MARDRLATWLLTYIPPFLIVFGTCGNALSLVILREKKFVKSSIGFTLSALAAVDTGVLWLTLTQSWIYEVTGVDYYVKTGLVGCKIASFLSGFLTRLSTATLVIVSVERSVSICWPMISKVYHDIQNIVFSYCTTN